MTAIHQVADGVAGGNDDTLLPDPDALAHSKALASSIRTIIEENGGSIGFDRFMWMALYEPGLGYYSAGARKFGRSGDFVTAPEISPLFSRALAAQCAEVLQTIGDGSLLEIGAGTGVMAADLLRELELLGCLPERYFILEISAELKARQRLHLANSIPHLLDRITWLDGLPARGFRGVMLANEVLDAQPVVRIEFTEGAIYEYRVCVDLDEFAWTRTIADHETTAQAMHIKDQLNAAWPDGYSTEINPGLGAWVSDLAAVLEQGIMLLIDYGYTRREYYHPQRDQGTLLCHYRHRAHPDPFLYPGLQDITASVDFTAVVEAGTDAGLDLLGYTNQAMFLLACGLEGLMNRLVEDERGSHANALAQAKILILPAGMGERFKVVALGRNYHEPLRGFALSDQRRHL